MPHDEIISAKLLKPVVRGAVLINRVFSEVEEYRGGNGARPAPCENDEPVVRVNDVLVDVAEK